MRGRNDFITGLESKAAHGDVKRIGAISTGNAVLHAEGLGPCLFKGIDLRATNECRLCDDFCQGGIYLRLDGQILSVEIDEWYFHCRAGSGSELDTSRRRSR